MATKTLCAPGVTSRYGCSPPATGNRPAQATAALLDSLPRLVSRT